MNGQNMSGIIKSITLFGLISILIAPGIKAQAPSKSVETVKKFSALQVDLPRESIYLHTDRDWYYYGDRIWFSAYVVAGSYNTLSQISTVLYVDLYAPEGKLVKREIIELESGRGDGSISFVGDEEISGTYQLKAYTAWALNFDDSYVFEKSVEVLSGESESGEKQPSEFIDIQFFPESGYLVQNLQTRLAFKAIGTDGLGEDVSGILYKESGTEVTRFETEHLGMGAIEFTPEDGLEYYAIVNDQRFELPAVQNDGVVMNLSQAEDFYSVEVRSTNTSSHELLLFGHVRGQVYHAALVSLEGGTSEVSIPKQKFATGIVHFTLLNTEGMPIAERLIYNKNKVDALNINLVTSKEQYGFREATDMDLSLADVDGNPVTGFASISVFDDKINPFNPLNSDIRTHLNLETELKGYIEQPGFYFSENDQANTYLDLLLLTQGWRAYDISTIAETQDIELDHLPETGFTVSGKVTGGLLKRAQKNAALFFSLGTQDGQAQVVTTDDEGRFVINNIHVQGEKRVSIRGNTEKGGNNININLDKQFSRLPEATNSIIDIAPSSSFNTVVSNEADLKDRAAAAQQESEQFIDAQMRLEMEEITVTSTRVNNSFAAITSETSSGLGSTVDLDDKEYLKNLSIVQILNQQPGVTAIIGSNSVEVNTGFTSINTTPEAIILIDDVYSDYQTLKNLPTPEIKSITVLRSSVDLAIFGAEGAGGAIIVTTRSGNGFQTDTRGFVTASVKGFQIPTEFYSPKYGITVPADLQRVDNRITLHWEPSVTVSGNQAMPKFWTNDVPSTYRIVVEGITEAGVPFYTTKTIEVSDN